MPPNARFFAGFTSSLLFRYSVMFIVRLQNFRTTPPSFGLSPFLSLSFRDLDVRRRSLRHHWRRAMARCYLSVWIWGGSPESGRAIHRTEDLVGDSRATFAVIGPIRAVEPTRESFRSG
jgi:hypothetical protein